MQSSCHFSLLQKFRLSEGYILCNQEYNCMKGPPKNIYVAAVQVEGTQDRYETMQANNRLETAMQNSKTRLSMRNAGHIPKETFFARQ